MSQDVEHEPDEPRSQRELQHEAAQVKLAMAACDLALARLTPRMGVTVANAVLRDQLDRLSDHQIKQRRRARFQADGFG